MEDVSMMDTTSDDELDFNTPLWKRIGRRHDSSYSMTGISGSAKDGKDLYFSKPYFEKMSDVLKTAGSSSATDAIAFGERGSPLSEMTSNISRSPPFSGKMTLDKGSTSVRSADCKGNSGGTSDSKADSCRGLERQESKRYPVPSKEGLSKTESASVNDVPGSIQHLDQKDSIQPRSRSSCMFSTERAETSGKQLSAESRSTLSDSPVKGGWRKLSPTESPRKFLNSPPFPRRHSGQSSPKSNIGSSVHIHWDKNKRMQSTSLESRTSSPYSPSKHRTNFSPNSSHSSPSLFGIRSPIVIPDTPELSGRRDMINERDNRSKESSQDLYMKRQRDNVLLNDLLSEGELDSSKDLLSSSSSSMHLLSSVSPSSRHKNRSSDRSFLSPSKKFKDYLLRKQEGSSERKVCSGKDPVWDFADEMLSSPEKHTPGFSRKLDHRRQKDGALSRDNTYLNKVVGTNKDSRSHQQCTSTTSEDDDLPLISLITNKQKSKSDACHKSSADSTKIKPGAMVTSPSRPWSSPPKKRSWGSPSRLIKPATVVISPWRSQTGSSCGMSSGMDTWIKNRPNQESTLKNSARSLSNEDTEDKISRRRATLAEAKKEKMKSLLAVFSSDEDEDVHPYADKKRKIEDDANGLEWMDEAAKRRKTNSHSPTKDCPGTDVSRKHESSVHSKHKGPSSLPIRVSDLGGISPDKKDRLSSLFGHHKTGGRNIPSTRAYISGRIKDTSRSSSASAASSASSLSYPNHGNTPTAAKSSKTSASLSNETFSSHASSGESVHFKKSKGKGKKSRKSPIDYSPSIEAHRTTSGRDCSPGPSDLPSSSGISVDTVTTVKDDSDDEVVMLDSFSYASSLVGSYGKKRKSHKKTEAKASSKGPSSSGATGSLDDERNTVSPSILQQLNQMDADEAMARRLQEEFDAEMARSVQQHGPPNRSTEDTNRQADAMACSSVGGADQPDAGTFGNFSPRHNISIEVSSDLPVQIGSFNWNYGFQPASTVLDRPDRPPAPPSPPSMHRRGRPNPRQRRSRRRNSDDRQDGEIPDLANPAHGGLPHNRQRPDMEMIWNLHHDLFPGRDIRWMAYPDYEHINTPPRPGRQQGRGRGRARGRRRDVSAHENDGNDYDALLQLADSLGPAVDKRLTQSSIDRLPTFKFTKGQHSGSEEENSCPICMDDYEEGAELRRLPCFHGYHKQCIDVWLKKNQDPVCPICRVEVRIE